MDNKTLYPNANHSPTWVRSKFPAAYVWSIWFLCVCYGRVIFSSIKKKKEKRTAMGSRTGTLQNKEKNFLTFKITFKHNSKWTKLVVKAALLSMVGLNSTV